MRPQWAKVVPLDTRELGTLNSSGQNLNFIVDPIKRYRNLGDLLDNI